MRSDIDSFYETLGMHRAKENCWNPFLARSKSASEPLARVLVFCQGLNNKQELFASRGGKLWKHIENNEMKKMETAG